MKAMSKQFCEYSLVTQKKICQYSFYDKYVDVCNHNSTVSIEKWSMFSLPEIFHLHVVSFLHLGFLNLL